MSITLSAETQKLIEERMRQGGFSSPDDLVRVALETLEVQGEDIEELDAQTQAAIERGEAQSARGEGIPLDEAFDRLRRKHFGR